MKLVSYVARGQASYGALVGGRIVDLSRATGAPDDLKGWIAGAPETLQGAATWLETAAETQAVNPAEITYLPVVPNPGKFICLGLNYADHAAEGGFDVPSYPELFMRASSSLLGAGQPLVRPRVSETFDFEAELVVVIGRGGRHLAEAQALDAVFGYTAFNDGSIREYQRRTAQWTAGKNFDATGPLGPVVVTADELPPGAHGLNIGTRLNGETVQSSNTEQMIFSVARTVSLLSEIMTLEPGDLIAMGTPSGVGHARRPPLWMKPGDVCEIEIEGIGVLSNPVIAEDSAPQTAEHV
jgi:acylpyruvate hydrolase